VPHPGGHRRGVHLPPEHAAKPLIDVLAVSNRDDRNQEHLILDGVDDPVVARSDSPELIVALKLFGVCGAWIALERVDLRSYLALVLRAQPLDELQRRGSDLDRVRQLPKRLLGDFPGDAGAGIVERFQRFEGVDLVLDHLKQA